KVYDSGLALSGSAQMCRGLSVLSLLLCLLALLLSVTGLKCTRCLGDAHETKARLGRVAAALFLAAAFFFLLPVCWSAYVVIRNFYDPNVAAPLKRELGPALYLGWGVTVLMLVGGALMYLGSASPGVPALPVFGKGAKGNPPSTAESKPEKVFV
ncbi:claudin-9-like, partial [Sinocyclocheilus rhinocerous]|uniref:claudin-9-like n=1 Tax=Sinocyclocheilus rhinocerous TaxID=307959 RepID=UPI0007B8AA53